jgi:two-component system, cell cycle sensor histidine kinase and response regulator CckA
MPHTGTLHLRQPDGELAPLLVHALAGAPAAAVLLDREAAVVGVNDAFQAVTGLPPDRVLGPRSVNVREILRRVRPDLVADLDQALRGEAVDLPEFFLQIPGLEGSRATSDRLSRGFWIWARAWPVRDAAGTVRLVAILFDDVTERRELEAMLVQAQKSETVSTMAAGVAHDVNNILSGVVGYASLLASRLPRGSTDHDAAMTILDSADRAAQLAAQLMTVSRRSALQLQALDPAEALPRIASLLARTLGADHPLRIDVAPDLLSVDADRPQLEQALANLCANARDAMPDGGPIVLRARNRRFDPGERRPRANMPAGEYVQIDIIDQGVGMTPEVAARIFEPFFTTKPMGPGVGLGLAVVHGIVKSHRGFIVVASRPGQGSVFSIFLPRSRTVVAPAATPVPPAATQQAPAAGPLSVLVIDDEPIVRRVLSEMLVRLGHQAVAVEGMDPAMDLLMRDRSRFDALIVDVFLPERSGLDLVEALRAAHFDLPVLVCTGYSSPEVQARVAALPGTRILPKPFNVEVLREALAKAFAGGE